MENEVKIEITKAAATAKIAEIVLVSQELMREKEAIREKLRACQREISRFHQVLLDKAAPE